MKYNGKYYPVICPLPIYGKERATIIMKSRPFGDMAVGVAWLDFIKREAGPSSILDF